MGHVAARAGDGAGLETPAQRQRLRAVESVRAPVGPELTLQIVRRNRLADQERQRVVRKVVAALEADKDVVLVAVTVGAGVVDTPWLGAARRKDFQRVAQLAILRAAVVLRLRGGIFLPSLHQGDVLPARPVTRLTADAHLGPGRSIFLRSEEHTSE